MKYPIKSMILGGVALFALSMSLISCEGTLDDVFGEWSKPTPSTPGPAAVTSITLNETTLYKNKGDAAVMLTATVVPENAADKTVTWSSDNPAVASVNNGEVTALAIGTAIITATANDGSGVKAICTVNVSAQGLLSGDFSIAADKKVRFAQGNLQAVIGSGPTNTYNYTASSWKFAVHQWDYIGNAAGNTTFAASSTVDLFGWVGTSATYDTYGLCIQNSSADTSDGSDFAKCYGNKNTDALKNDWGKLLIVNGGDAPNYGWRTLSKDEWEWLIGPVSSPNPGTNCRTSSKIGDVTNARWVKARVHSTDGLIIFPDEISWDTSTMGAAPTVINNQAAAFATKAFSDAQWEALETAGCVFLPGAGQRTGKTVGDVGNGRYWTSTVNNHDDSKALHIAGNEVNMGGIRYRTYGYSVRLVMDVK